jgi:hypothetical protein
MTFKSSAEVFDAGYAVPSYDIDTNTLHWRFKGETFVSPRIVCTEYADVNGARLPVYPISELEKYRVRKTD